MVDPSPIARPVAAIIASHPELCPIALRSRQQLARELNEERFKNQLLAKWVIHAYLPSVCKQQWLPVSIPHLKNRTENVTLVYTTRTHISNYPVLYIDMTFCDRWLSRLDLVDRTLEEICYWTVLWSNPVLILKSVVGRPTVSIFSSVILWKSLTHFCFNGHFFSLQTAQGSSGTCRDEIIFLSGRFPIRTSARTKGEPQQKSDQLLTRRHTSYLLCVI